MHSRQSSAARAAAPSPRLAIEQSTPSDEQLGETIAFASKFVCRYEAEVSAPIRCEADNVHRQLMQVQLDDWVVRLERLKRLTGRRRQLNAAVPRSI